MSWLTGFFSLVKLLLEAIGLIKKVLPKPIDKDLESQKEAEEDRKKYEKNGRPS